MLYLFRFEENDTERLKPEKGRQKQTNKRMHERTKERACECMSVDLIHDGSIVHTHNK